MFKIKLEIDNRQYDLENISYSANTYLNADESPSSSANLNISIKMNKIDQSLLDWCLQGAGQSKDGKVVIFDSDKDILWKTISFKKGYCSALNGSVYPNDEYNTYPISLNISAEKLGIVLEKSRGKRQSDE